MKQEYEDIIRKICLLGDWREADQPEKDGAVGVAIILAYLKGVRLDIDDVSRHLGLDRNLVEVPFRRLLTNGVFSQKYNLKEDTALLGKKKTYWQTSAEYTRNAWCVLAGISAGLTGLRES